MRKCVRALQVKIYRNPTSEYIGASQNRRWKLGQWIKLVALILKPVHSWLSSYIFFLGIKLFCFSRWNAEIFSICLKKEFHETSQNFNSIKQAIEKIKITIVWMCWNSLLNRCQKFHLSILKNKKVLYS